ncbi:MAG: hypothetical protein M1830_002054 [Pleopsidium flavum]|nr:MAG: hypothetical protein M1830_002054 [Pleopsidium flavum]
MASGLTKDGQRGFQQMLTMDLRRNKTGTRFALALAVVSQEQRRNGSGGSGMEKNDARRE